MTGNLEKAQQIFELWARTYPREIKAPSLLSGMVYPVFGKYEKAVEAAKTAIAIDPEFPFSYATLATAYQFLNRLQEADSVYQRASDSKLLTTEMLLQRYDLAFLRGDKARMENLASLPSGEPPAESWISAHKALCPGIFW